MAGGAFDFPLPDPLIWMAYVAARSHAHHQARHRHSHPAAAQPGHHCQAGGDVGCARRRARAARHRRWLVEGGVRRHRRLVRGSRRAHGRIHRRVASAVVAGATVLSGANSFVSTVPIAARSRCAARCRFTSAATRKRRRGAPDVWATVSFRPEATRRNWWVWRGRAQRKRAATRQRWKSRLAARRVSTRLPALAKLGVHRVLVPVNPTPGMANAARNPEQVLAWRSRIEDYADGRD